MVLPLRAAKLSTAIRPRRAITTEAVLSFLSLGVDPTVPIWGGKLRAGSPDLQLHPHLLLFPGLLILVMLAVRGFNAMGDAIREILDPGMLNRLRGGRTT